MPAAAASGGSGHNAGQARSRPDRLDPAVADDTGDGALKNSGNPLPSLTESASGHHTTVTLTLYTALREPA